MEESIAVIFLALMVCKIIDWISPPDEKHYFGCGCLYYTRDGGMGREIGKCAACREQLMKLIKDMRGDDQ